MDARIHTGEHGQVLGRRHRLVPVAELARELPIAVDEALDHTHGGPPGSLLKPYRLCRGWSRFGASAVFFSHRPPRHELGSPGPPASSAPSSTRRSAKARPVDLEPHRTTRHASAEPRTEPAIRSTTTATTYVPFCAPRMSTARVIRCARYG